MKKHIFNYLYISCICAFLLSGCGSLENSTDNTTESTTQCETSSGEEKESETMIPESAFAQEQPIEYDGEIWTEYFTMTVPECWKEYYLFELSPDGEELQVDMISQNDRGKSALFTMYILPLADSDNIKVALDDWIEPVGILDSTYDEQYLLGVWYASELTCMEAEEAQFLKMVDTIPELLQTLKPVGDHEILPWEESMRKKLLLDVPYVAITSNILGTSLQAYKNQSDEVVYEMNNRSLLDGFYVSQSDNIAYYYSGDGVLLGVVDDTIVLFGRYASAQIGESSCSIRDLINRLGATELFSITPGMINIDGGALSFYYWQIANGYIGFAGVGGNVPEECYNYTAHQVIIFTESELLTILDTKY